MCFRSGWIIRTCRSMSSAWCSTWSNWAWTTRFKKAKRTRFGPQLFSSFLCRCTASDKGASLLGALHRGALPRQLVPRNQSPLQPAPCHQLCQSASSRDGAGGEEGGSAQHQYRGLFLRPGKQYYTAASIHHDNISNGYIAGAATRRSCLWHRSNSASFSVCTSCSCKRKWERKTMQVFQVNRRYSRELQGRCFLPHLLRCLFCPPAANGPAH